MRIRTVIGAVLLPVVLTACSVGTSAPRSTGSPFDSSARTPSVDSVTPSIFGEVPQPAHRRYPSTTVDVRDVPSAHIATDGLALGPPPRTPWIHPTPRWVHKLGNDILPVPRGLALEAELRNQYVLTGGCMRAADRCGARPAGGLHLMTSDGTLTHLDGHPGPHRVANVVTSSDRRALAWTVDAAERHAVYRLTGPGVAPERLPDPATSLRRAFPRVVGFLGSDDLVIAVVAPGGRTLGYLRTSGEPAPWDARSLTVLSPRALLGRPGFTRGHQECLSRFAAGRAKPAWTRCYTWGDRPVDGFYSPSVSADGRRLATVVDGDDVVLVDLRTGTPTHRIHFDHRAESVRFEDPDHFLVVLSRQEHPERDSWPIGRIVRCDLELVCARATRDHEITAFDMLRFPGD
jgi:hypothetical protein